MRQSFERIANSRVWTGPFSTEKGNTMPRKFEWPIHTSSPARDLRWQAIEALTPLLPKPHNWITAMGRGFRKLRLDKELAEYDLLHRLHHGRPATLEELTCAGTLLISSCKDNLPTAVLPLDEELLVNAKSFALLAGWVEEKLDKQRSAEDSSGQSA